MIAKVAAVLLVVSMALSVHADPAGPITADSVLREMNACRAEAGLPPLQRNALLDLAAEDRMRDMEELGYWSHQSPDGRSPFSWLRIRGYNHIYAAENLATGFETTSLLVQSWMESKGHRANIMSPLYLDAGIAIIDGSTVKRSAGRSVVVLFARQQTR